MGGNGGSSGGGGGENSDGGGDGSGGSISIPASHLQIDSGERGQVLEAIEFPLRSRSVSLVKEASGLMSPI